MEVAFIIGHTKLSKGAYSDYFKSYEYDFYQKFKCELEEIGDVFTHNSINTGYNNRQKKTAEKTKDYDIVFEVHFNSLDKTADGCEAWHYYLNQESREICMKFCRTYSELTGVRNRGAKYLSKSSQRGYGFVKHQKPNAIILEPFFGDNQGDCKAFEIGKFIEAINKSISC